MTPMHSTKVAMTNWTKDKLITAQNKLSKLGFYNLNVDGLWGPGTSTALQNFAKQKGLSLGNNPKIEIPSDVFESLINS